MLRVLEDEVRPCGWRAAAAACWACVAAQLKNSLAQLKNSLAWCTWRYCCA